MSAQPSADDHLRTVAANGRVLWHGQAYRDDRLIAHAGEQVHVCELPGSGLFVSVLTDDDPTWVHLHPEPRGQKYPDAEQDSQPQSKLLDDAYADLCAAAAAFAALTAAIYSAEPVTEQHRSQLWTARFRWRDASANLSAILDAIEPDC
jgi:hypothetical protein